MHSNLGVKKSKPTLESLLKDNQVMSGQALLKRVEDKKSERALFQEAVEFERRNKKAKR